MSLANLLVMIQKRSDGDGSPRYHSFSRKRQESKIPGEVRERPNRTHSKCVVLQGTVGSNPTLSAKQHQAKTKPKQSQMKATPNITMPRAKRPGHRILIESTAVQERSETDLRKQVSRPKARRNGNYRRNMATMVRSENEARAFHSPRWVPTHAVIEVVRAPSKAFAAAVESSTRYKPRAKPCS